MDKCGKCGTEIQPAAKYCKSCGGSRAFDEKKARVMNGERTWIKPAVIMVIVAIALIGGWMFKESRAGNPMSGQTSHVPQREASARVGNAEAVTLEDGEVRIPLKNVEDGNAHFYSYAAAGRTITFFLMRAEDGNIKAAFDACMACNHAKLGYRQEGSKVVCNNCGMGFSPSEIGKMKGGCNPIPIEKSVDGGMIVLKGKDLEAGAQYF